MLLTIHNLPSSTRYLDVKALLHEKCGLTELILDNLVTEGNTKKVTVGLAEEGDAAILVRKINGLYINGLQLYVEDKRKKRDSEQPYRSSASLVQEYQESVAPQNPMGDMATMNNAMMMNMNYNMTGMYVPMMPIDQSMSYMGYSGYMAMPAAEPRPPVPANERGCGAFQGDGGAPGGRPREPRRSRSRKRRASPAGPAGHSDRPSRWNAPGDAPRREPSPPRQPWPARDPDQPPPRPEPRRGDPEWRPRAPRWEDERRPPPPAPEPRWEPPPGEAWRPEPERAWRPEPEAPWRDAPAHALDDDNRRFDNWERDFPPESEGNYPGLERFEPNDRRFDEGFPPPHREPEFHGPSREEAGERDRDRRPRRGDDWNAGNKRRVKDHPSRDEPAWDRREEEPRRPARPSRPDNHDPKPSNSNRKDRRDQRPNPATRASQERQRGPADWNQVANYYPPAKRPREAIDTHDDIAPEPRRNKFPPGPRRHNFSPEPRHNNMPPEPHRNNFPPETHRNNFPPETHRNNFPPETHRNNFPPEPHRNNMPPEPRHNNFPPEPHHTNLHPEPRRNHFPPESRRNNFPSEPHRNDFPPEPRRNNMPPESRRNNMTPEPRRNNFPPEPRRNNFAPEPRRNNLPPKPPKPRQETTQKPAERRPPLTQASLSDHKPKKATQIINKDQTSRGQATAKLYKYILSGINQSKFAGTKIIPGVIKELKICIRSRIDVMLGEELTNSSAVIIERYRIKYPVKDDKALFHCMKDKVCQRLAKEEMVQKTGKNTATVKIEKVEAEANVKSEPTASVPKAEKGKLPKHAMTDKQIINEVKQARKVEFSKADHYKMDPITDKCVNEELAKITEIFTSECADPADDVEKAICDRIATHSVDEFVLTARLHLAKRILDIRTGLAIRIFADGKLPRRCFIKEYLKSYRVERLALKKNKKGTMYVANLSNFDQYDRLCQLQNDVIDGTPVTIRSMYLVGPPPKLSRKQVLQRRRQFISSQVEPRTDYIVPPDTETDEKGQLDVNKTEPTDSTIKDDTKGNINAETIEDFTTDDFDGADFGADDLADDPEGLNIANIKEEDLEDF